MPSARAHQARHSQDLVRIVLSGQTETMSHAIGPFGHEDRTEYLRAPFPRLPGLYGRWSRGSAESRLTRTTSVGPPRLHTFPSRVAPNFSGFSPICASRRPPASTVRQIAEPIQPRWRSRWHRSAAETVYETEIVYVRLPELELLTELAFELLKGVHLVIGPDKAQLRAFLSVLPV